MKPLLIVSFEQRLDNLFGKVDRIGEVDLETQAHWARYLCILVSGYMEISVRATLSQYTRNRADPKVFSYVEGQLERFQNPKVELINQLIRAFDPTVANKIESLDNAMKDAVDSVVNNRNQIAHGRDIGIGAVTVKNYYTEVKKFVSFLCTELE